MVPTARTRARTSSGATVVALVALAACNAVTGIGDLEFTSPKATSPTTTSHTSTTTTERFTDDGASVHDATTGLDWQQNIDATKRTWEEASAYCDGNEPALPGAGWRLPTGAELLGIVESSQSDPAIDSTAFPGTQPDLFWTADNGGANATAVGFAKGKAVDTPVSTPCLVRCVRP